MIEISWHQLEKNTSSLELSFESFCFQIALKKYSSYGKFESFYNTPGSEFYLELSKDCEELNSKAGDTIGWQAKFWLNKKDEDNSPLDSKHRDELIKGLKKSLVYKANLTHWIICTPGKFSNTKTKSTPPWDSLKNEVARVKEGVNLSHWHKDIFEGIFHSDPEEYSSIFNLYFNGKIISKDFLINFTRNNLQQLERKFDVDLHVKDEEELGLLNFIYPDNSALEISKYIKHLKDLTDEINKDYRINSKGFDNLESDFVDSTKNYYLKHLETLKEIYHLHDKLTNTYDLAKEIKNSIESLILNREPHRMQLNEQVQEINNKYNDNKINLEEIDWVNFMINNQNKICDLLIGSNKENSLLDTLNKSLSSNFHVFGAAGYGKTHFACSISYHLLRNDNPVLLFLGSSFRNSATPKQRILQLLELNDHYTFKDFLGALDLLGKIYNCRIPIIIDGLNESFPSAGVIWNGEIYTIINDINSFSNIIFITTCREKREYIQQVFDKTSYKMIENSLYLKGFTNKNIPAAINKYFNKYKITASSKPYNISLFENPLRLKIFCEVNKEKRNLDINLFSIIESIDLYLKNLISKISIKDHSFNAVNKSKLNKGLYSIGQQLWTSNKRELQFSDFYPVFDEELSFKLLDEGLCFQRELNDDDELIQFTYDLVGGYQIAKSVFFTEKNPKQILEKLKSDDTKEKLFSVDKSKRHQLHEDILKSISYLLPIKTKMHIYEVISDEFILIESIENIELLTSTQDDKAKFINFINGIDLSSEFIESLFQKLYDDVVQRNTFNSFDIIIKVFLNLNQYEIDIFWNELIRVNSYKLQKKLKTLINNDVEIEHYKDNVLLFVLLLTGTTDKLLRSIATKVLMKLGLKYPFSLFNLTKSFILVNDNFILESLICALTGVTLRIKDIDFTKIVSNFLKDDFLTQNQTNHVAILDYSHTILEFGRTHYNLDYDIKTFYRNINEVWTIEKEREDKNSSESIFSSYEFMDYDFIKFQINQLSSESYNNNSSYSRSEIISYINNRIKLKGYNEEMYSETEKKIAKDNKYRRENVSEQVVKYIDKYLYITYLELAGFLILNNEINPEYKNTFRFSYIFFDPTFPTVKTKTQIINDCFLPVFNEEVQKWILKDPSAILNEHYRTIPPFEEEEMVLLYAKLNQKNEENNTYISILIDTFIFEKKYEPNIIETLKSNYCKQTKDFCQMFGGEITWRDIDDRDLEAENTNEQISINLSSNNSINESINSKLYSMLFYNDDMRILSENNKIDDNNEGISVLNTSQYYPLVNFYSWSSWSNERYQNPGFLFLDSTFAKQMKLFFNINDLEHIDKNGKSITKYYKTNNSEFLYIERKILENHLKKHKCNLIWRKSISKYGEFGIYKNKVLEPSYKSINTFTLYPKIDLDNKS